MSSGNSWDAPAPMMESRSTGRGPAKGLADYLKGMRRRIWLILFVSAVAGGAGTAFTLKQAPIFWASSRILIEPPRAIVEGMDQQGASNDSAALNFFNTRVQMVTSRRIAERVLSSLQLKNWEELNGVQDPVGELLGWIVVKPVKNSNLVDVGLEGSDSKLVAKIVNSVVDEFLRHEQESLREFDQLSRSRIETELRGLEGMVQGSRQAISDFHKQHENFLMNGDSVEAGRLVILEEAKQQAELRLDAARRAVDQFDALRKAGVPFVHETNQKAITTLQDDIRKIDDELQYQKEVIRPERYDTDVAIRRLREKREELLRSSSGYGDAEFEMIRLKQEVQFAQADLAHLVEIADKQRKIVLSQQDEHHQLNTLRGEHERLATTTDFIAKKRLEAEMHHGLVAPRIQVIDRAEEPREPIRPIKILQIPLCIIGGVVLGCLSAIALEFMDASIREPEQAIESLDWPLLGVIPKLSRRAIMSHGRPVLAAQMPGTIFCEAFRNLRTGVLGAEGEQELRSLLVTSAKAGEGKTLVACNLAAACARAGESVLLVDVDLRNPGLGRYFDIAPSNLGLAEVLEGNVPWQKVLLQTDVDNLTVIPAGDADGVSIDILGTVEMHDLLAELVQKFDRVILDGSPFLGLADSRVVGRFSDGVLFVVQSGSHDCRPLRRVRQMFDHEGLRAAGLVFNGLREQHDDLTTLRRSAVVAPPTNRRRRLAQSA